MKLLSESLSVRSLPAVRGEVDSSRRPTKSICCRGCVASRTKVLMADGTIKPIDDVRIGERVLSRTADGEERVCRVASAMRGVEDSLVVIEVDDALQLRCTASHPVLTPNGAVRADRIDETSLVACAEGGWRKVRRVRAEFGGMVCSLALVADDSRAPLSLEDVLRDPCTFWADGILVGDVAAQAALERGCGSC